MMDNESKVNIYELIKEILQRDFPIEFMKIGEMVNSEKSEKQLYHN